MVKTLPSNTGGPGLIPGWGAGIPHTSQPENQNIKQKQYCHKFNKIFKTGVHIKKIKYINKITLKKKIYVLVVLCGAPLKTGELVFRPGHGFCWSCPQHPCSSYPGPTPLPSSWGPSHIVRLCLGGEVSGWFVF